MKNWELNKRFFTFFIIILLGYFVIQFIGNSSITGFATSGDIFGNVGNFFSTPVGMMDGGSVPLYGLILGFALVFSIIYILTLYLPFFKDQDKRGAAMVFSIAVSLITIFATDIAAFIAGFVSTIVYLIVLLTILLLAWAWYVKTHVSVSEGFNEIAKTASTRFENEGNAVTSRGTYETAKRAYDTIKDETKVLKNLRRDVYKKDKNLIAKRLKDFDSLNSKVSMFNNDFNRILNDISRRNLSTAKKTDLQPYLDEVGDLEGSFKDKVKDVRNKIEEMKRAIKANKFPEAEGYLNQAINLQQDLESSMNRLKGLEKEINSVINRP